MSSWFRDHILEEGNLFEMKKTGRIVPYPQIPESLRLIPELMIYRLEERKGG